MALAEKIEQTQTSDAQLKHSMCLSQRNLQLVDQSDTENEMELSASTWSWLRVVKQSTGSLRDLPCAEGRMDRTRCSQEQAGQNTEEMGREQSCCSEGLVGNEAAGKWPGGSGGVADGQCELPQAARHCKWNEVTSSFSPAPGPQESHRHLNMLTLVSCSFSAACLSLPHHSISLLFPCCGSSDFVWI